MPQPSTHPFLELGRSERSRWIAAFCEGASAPPPGLTLVFPLLPRGESPLAWLRDQFHRAEVTGQRPDRLRDSVVDLLCGELGRIELVDWAQALGVLVDLAGSCGFREVAPKLRDWVRGDHFSTACYRVDGHTVPLRQTLWSTLIAWGNSEDMVIYLKRDLGRPDLKCGALCFSALGRISPADAIAEIPTTFEWPSPYWEYILRRFFENFVDAARTLLAPHLLPAWQSCLGVLLYDPELSERFRSRWGQFRQMLTSAGIELIFDGRKIELRPKDRPIMSAQIDTQPFIHQIDQRLYAFFQGLFDGANTPWVGTGA